jgi:hypothetical protein
VPIGPVDLRPTMADYDFKSWPKISISFYHGKDLDQANISYNLLTCKGTLRTCASISYFNNIFKILNERTNEFGADFHNIQSRVSPLNRLHPSYTIAQQELTNEGVFSNMKKKRANIENISMFF